MSWRTASIMDQRIRLVLEAQEGFHSISELARRYGISRPTAYKWIRRYREEGLEGLTDRSHRTDLLSPQHRP